MSQNPNPEQYNQYSHAAGHVVHLQGQARLLLH